MSACSSTAHFAKDAMPARRRPPAQLRPPQLSKGATASVHQRLLHFLAQVRPPEGLLCGLLERVLLVPRWRHSRVLLALPARAKSAHRANRSSGSLANATSSTRSSAASLGRVSARAGGGVLRLRLMTTAALECGKSWDPVRRWYAVAARPYSSARPSSRRICDNVVTRSRCQSPQGLQRAAWLRGHPGEAFDASGDPNGHRRRTASDGRGGSPTMSVSRDAASAPPVPQLWPGRDGGAGGWPAPPTTCPSLRRSPSVCAAMAPPGVMKCTPLGILAPCLLNQLASQLGCCHPSCRRRTRRAPARRVPRLPGAPHPSPRSTGRTSVRAWRVRSSRC